MKTYTMMAAVLALSLTPALAEEAVPQPPKDTPNTPKEAQAPDMKNKGTRMQLMRLAAEFNVTEEQVIVLRGRGMGWGDVRHTLVISRAADQPVSEVLKLRDSGMGWGKIAQHYGFKLGELNGRALRDDELKDDIRDAVGERRDAERGKERGNGRGGVKDGGEGRGTERKGPPAGSRGGSKR